MKLNKTKLYSLLALLSAANFAFADNYQNEASIGISDGDADSGGISVDTESIDLSFVANFSEVDTSKGPLAEASFIDRASNFSIAYSDGEIADVDVTDLSLGLRFVGKESGFTGELLVTDGEVGDIDTESLGVSLGYYVGANTEISIAYLGVEVDGLNTDSGFLAVKHVSTGSVAVAVEAVIGTVDTVDGDDTATSLGVTLYPNSQLGIGAAYATVDSSVDNDSLEVFAEWFITPVAAVSLRYTDTEIGALNTDSIALSTRFRF